jgi:hypothetical protein
MSDTSTESEEFTAALHDLIAGHARAGCRTRG